MIEHILRTLGLQSPHPRHRRLVLPHNHGQCRDRRTSAKDGKTKLSAGSKHERMSVISSILRRSKIGRRFSTKLSFGPSVVRPIGHFPQSLGRSALDRCPVGGISQVQGALWGVLGASPRRPRGVPGAMDPVEAMAKSMDLQRSL